MAKANTRSNVSVTNSAELLSYIINVDPILSEEIELPVQGQNINEIGKIIMSNERHKNAFINTVNLIGLTVIKRTMFKNPWGFTNKGSIKAGESVREIVVNLVEAYDYNLYKDDVTHFLDNEVPNIMSYIHEINFQKFYKTTTDDTEMAMAFESESGLFDLIDKIVGKLYESLEQDTFLLDKYQLARRILDGTTGVEYLEDGLTTREIVARMKAISNEMEFISGDFNPAGYEYSVASENQMTIFDSRFEGRLTAEVLATSYYKNEADMQNRKKLVNKFTFSPSEEKRLLNLLNKDAEASLFTEEEVSILAGVKAVILDEDFFQDRTVNLGLSGTGDKKKEFENPETLKTSHWLHAWRIFSTSPYSNIVAIVTGEAPSITDIEVELNGSEVDTTFSIANNSAGTIELDTLINVVGTNIYNHAYFVEVTDSANRLTFKDGKFRISKGDTALNASVKITSIGNKEVVKEFTVTTTVA